MGCWLQQEQLSKAKTPQFYIGECPRIQLSMISYYRRDPRNPAAPLRRHTSTHSDDITVVRFSPNKSQTSPVLLSASTDGLLCTSDPLQDDEDEATLSVGNWRCSISKAGWMHNSGGGGPRAWAVSDMETVSFWSEEVRIVRYFPRIRNMDATLNGFIAVDGSTSRNPQRRTRPTESRASLGDGLHC